MRPRCTVSLKISRSIATPKKFQKIGSCAIPAPEPSETWPQYLHRNLLEPDLNICTRTFCTGTFRNLTQHICTKAIHNLIKYLQRNTPKPRRTLQNLTYIGSAPEPSRTSAIGSAPEPSGTWFEHLHRELDLSICTGTFCALRNLARNLVLKLHRIVPELIWAKNPIAKCCCWGKTVAYTDLEIVWNRWCPRNRPLKWNEKSRYTKTSRNPLPSKMDHDRKVIIALRIPCLEDILNPIYLDFKGLLCSPCESTWGHQPTVVGRATGGGTSAWNTTQWVYSWFVILTQSSGIHSSESFVVVVVADVVAVCLASISEKHQTKMKICESTRANTNVLLT